MFPYTHMKGDVVGRWDGSHLKLSMSGLDFGSVELDPERLEINLRETLYNALKDSDIPGILLRMQESIPYAGTNEFVEPFVLKEYAETEQIAEAIVERIRLSILKMAGWDPAETYTADEERNNFLFHGLWMAEVIPYDVDATPEGQCGVRRTTCQELR